MKRPLGTIARYAAAWFLVVSAAAALSWVAIARAGTEASLLGAAPPLGSATAASVGVVASSSWSAATIPTTAPTLVPSPTTSSRPPTPVPPRNSLTPPVTRSSSSPSSSSSTSSGGRSDVQSFTSAGGQVLAFCTGSAPHIRSVIATEGWRFEISEDASKVEVHFQPPSGHDDLEIKIRCAGGSPVFSTD